MHAHARQDHDVLLVVPPRLVDDHPGGARRRRATPDDDVDARSVPAAETPQCEGGPRAHRTVGRDGERRRPPSGPLGKGRGVQHQGQRPDLLPPALRDLAGYGVRTHSQQAELVAAAHERLGSSEFSESRGPVEQCRASWPRPNSGDSARRSADVEQSPVDDGTAPAHVEGRT